MVKTFKKCEFLRLVVFLYATTFIFGTKAEFNKTFESSKENCSLICDTYCLSEACVSTSHQLISYMDSTLDPCEDFYQFACGEFEREFRNGEDTYFVGDMLQEKEDLKIKNFLESEWKSSDEAINAVFQQLKTFHASCINKEKTEYTKVRKFFFETLTNVEFGDSKDREVTNLTKILTGMLKYGECPFFSAQTGVFNYEINRFEVSVSPPSFSQPYFSQYGHNYSGFQDKNWKSKITPFNTKFRNKTAIMENWNTEYLEELNLRTKEFLEYVFPDFEKQTLTTLGSDLKQFYQKFLYMNSSPNKNESETSFKISQLQESYRWINWKILFEDIFGRAFSDDFLISVESVAYFNNLNNLFNSYIEANNQTTLQMAAFALFYDNALLELVGEQDWKSCMKVSKEALSHSISIIYDEMVSTQLKQSIHEDTTLLFDELKKSFTNEIGDGGWMSPEELKKELKKLKLMKGEFAILKFKPDDEIFQNLTSDVVLDETDFFLNTLKLYSQHMITQRNGIKLKKISKKFKSYFQETHHYEAAINHYPDYNKIALNLGGFNPPHYISGAPKYVTFGNLGFVMAHEMAHAFGPNGVRHDSAGYENEWSTTQDEQGFQNNSRCFVEWYSHAFDQLFNGKHQTSDEFKLNGETTLDENMADYGINIAYQAYKRWTEKNPEEAKLPGIKFDPDQVFFISAAHAFCSVYYLEDYAMWLETKGHTPNRERVNSWAMNSQHFSNVFKCSANSTMNPPNRCSLWPPRK